MFLKKSYLLIIIFISFLFAAEPNKVFTLDVAIDYALAHSPQYEIIKKERAIIRSQAFQGYGAVLPHLSLTHTNSTVKTPELETSGDNNQINTEVTNLSVQQLLFSFSGLAAVKAGNASRLIADHNFAEASQLFILAVKRKYYDLQIAKQMVAINQRVSDTAAQQAKNAEIRYRNGLSPKTYYLDARVAELNAQRDLATSKKNSVISLQSFNNYIGRNLTAEIAVVTANQKTELFSLSDNLDVGKLTQTAYAQRPLYLAYLELAKLAQSDNINAWGDSLPQVYYQYNNQNKKQVKESAFAPNGITETSSIYLSWKFFSGGANLHRLGEKKHNQEKTLLEQEILKNNIKIEIENNLREVELAINNYAIATEADQLADESLKLVNLSFKEGLATNNDFNTALANYMRTKTTKSKALFDYQYAVDKLNYSVGEKVI